MITSWKDLFEQEKQKDYYKKIIDFVLEDAKSHEIYPPREYLFNAFNLTPYDKVKCLILGQDPYHNPGQAHGLSFSVQKEIQKPPSLVNIFKELKSDLNIDSPDYGDLTSWAQQGVLLLNSILTVRKNEPASHKDCGWQTFTDQVLFHLNEKDMPMVFVLWGSFARKKKSLITNNKHLVLESAHPSPLSAYNGFFGSKPFSKTNEFLIVNNTDPINWRL